jgi:hypothetical protein
MIRRNKYGAAALALGFAVSTLATPSFAQRAEERLAAECAARLQRQAS